MPGVPLGRAMKALPPIGSRVTYPGSKLGVIGPCSGVVVRHFRRGYIEVKVDAIPSAWPYPGDTFAPKFSEVREEGK